MRDRDEVRRCMLDALRHDLALGDDVDEALAANADDYMLELDSKTAEFLLVKVEMLTSAELPAPADLDPEQYSSLGALIDVAMKGIW